MGNLCTKTTATAATTATTAAATTVTLENRLMEATNEIPYWSFKNQTLIGKVVNVYDGDTCTVVVLFKSELMKFRMRMAGYDSPELRNTSVPNYKNTNEYTKACNAKQALIDLVLNKQVTIESTGWDKYGRLLGNMFVTNKQTNSRIHVNQWMIQHGHGYIYDGGKKKDVNPEDLQQLEND
jgi:endonuclease YncB( thermonuclease family)